jgi:hypothetical protein
MMREHKIVKQMPLMDQETLGNQRVKGEQRHSYGE